MKEVTKKYNVYEFNELDKEIQERLIAEEIESIKDEYCDLFLYEDMEQKARELLRENFGDKAEIDTIYYSLNYCQGDGAMIQFTLNYYNNILKIRQWGNYTHSRSFIIDGDITEKRNDKLYRKIVLMNEKLEKYGYELIEECSTEQDAINNLSCLSFLKNGEIFID